MASTETELSTAVGYYGVLHCGVAVGPIKLENKTGQGLLRAHAEQNAARVSIHVSKFEQEFSRATPSSGSAVRCVAISDTHGIHEALELPRGDVLIHCGDFTNAGTVGECKHFASWAESLPFKHKILVPGNHDFPCDVEWYRDHWQDDCGHESFQSPSEFRELLRGAGFLILNHEFVRIEGLGVYGCPMQPRMPRSRPQMAFGRARGQQMKTEWARLPSEGIDLLLTHCPPMGIMDKSAAGKMIGCEELASAVRRIAPAAHVFGHVHDGYGVYKTKRTCFINAASSRERRGVDGEVNQPITFDIYPLRS